MRVSCLPDDSHDSGWMGQLSSPLGCSELVGAVAASHVVVGAGFSGVAAARRLAELAPQEDVILVDGVGIGQGSAGRSSGFVVSIGHFNERSSATNQKIFRLGRAGIDALRELVERFQIGCHWNEAGRMIGASTRSSSRTLARICRTLDRIAAPYEEIAPEEFRVSTGMHGVRAAIRQIDSVLVQPAELLRGLVESLPDNVTVYEHSPVTRIDFGKPIVLECPEGSIRAGTLILTTNAHLPSFGMADNRVFPIRTFASFATPQNGSNELEAKHKYSDETEWGFTSAGRVGSSFRRLWNGQYLVRNTAYYGLQSSDSEEEQRLVSEVHCEALERRFPDLGPWVVEQTWSGVIGISANSASYFAQARDNLYSVSGHNGHGIAHGTIAGELLAEWSYGRSSSLLDDFRKLPRPSWIPKGLLLKTGVESVMGFLNWRFRGEL